MQGNIYPVEKIYSDGVSLRAIRDRVVLIINLLVLTCVAHYLTKNSKNWISVSCLHVKITDVRIETFQKGTHYINSTYLLAELVASSGCYNREF